MNLNLQTHKVGNVAVIRCQGRLVIGEEIRALQQEFEKLSPVWKLIVLQMAEVNFIDSGALGALVRHFGVLKNTGGHLKLCQVSPFVLQVLQATNLDRVFHPSSSESEAIAACSLPQPLAEQATKASKTKVVCIDTSEDLLAYLRTLLQRSGYEVLTTRHPSDAAIFIRVTQPNLVIFGPGTHKNESTIENLRKTMANVPVLTLPPDFAGTEASQAGADFLARVQELLPAKKI